MYGVWILASLFEYYFIGCVVIDKHTKFPYIKICRIYLTLFYSISISLVDGFLSWFPSQCDQRCRNETSSPIGNIFAHSRWKKFTCTRIRVSHGNFKKCYVDCIRGNCRSLQELRFQTIYDSRSASFVQMFGASLYFLFYPFSYLKFTFELLSFNFQESWY